MQMMQLQDVMESLAKKLTLHINIKNITPKFITDYRDLLQKHKSNQASFQQNKPKSLDEVDPEILKTYEKLGIPLEEREILAGVREVDMGHGGMNMPTGSNVAVDV